MGRLTARAGVCGTVERLKYAIIFVLTNLVNALSLVPGSLGWFEATMAGYASTAGIGDEKGAAFAIVNRIAALTLLVLGGWLIVHSGLT